LERTKKKLSFDEAKLKIASYCAYQERCQQEVRDKLYGYELVTPEVDDLIGFLITEGYLNELRFSKSFCGGKFRIKKWGKIRIQMELKKRKLSDNCIQKGLEEIEDQDYLNTLQILIKSKLKKHHENTAFEQRAKIAAFLTNKGYENELVWDQLRIMIKT